MPRTETRSIYDLAYARIVPKKQRNDDRARWDTRAHGRQRRTARRRAGNDEPTPAAQPAPRACANTKCGKRWPANRLRLGYCPECWTA